MSEHFTADGYEMNENALSFLMLVLIFLRKTLLSVMYLDKGCVEPYRTVRLVLGVSCAASEKPTA